MKEIGKEKFGILYDELYEYLTRTGCYLEGVGIEKGNTNEVLSNMWNTGKTWETIALLISYHYSRTDSCIIRFSNISTVIFKGSSLNEIQKLLGIKRKREKEYKISKEEFTEEFNKIWELLKGKHKIDQILSNLGIFNNDRPLLNCYWKLGKLWETITAIIIILRLRSFEKLEIETEYWNLEFYGEVNAFKILESIQNKTQSNS